MHYVIGDVHGCYEECMRLIKKIEREDNYARFIFIGDVIDRGPDSVKMLRWCMEHVKEGGKYQMLMGNHELMFMEWCSSQWFPYCEGKGYCRGKNRLYKVYYVYHLCVRTEI